MTQLEKLITTAVIGAIGLAVIWVLNQPADGRLDAHLQLDGSPAGLELRLGELRVYNQTDGWFSVSSGARLTDEKPTATSSQKLPAGTYTRLELEIAQATTRTPEATSSAVLASEEITTATNLIIRPDATSHLEITVDALASLHETADGGETPYVFLPTAEIRGWTNDELTTHTRIGVDTRGIVRYNWQLDQATRLDVTDEGIVILEPTATSTAVDGE